MAAPARYRRVRRVKLVAAQGAAVAVAAVFLAIGVAGFLPGITTERLLGRPGDGDVAQILGVFDTSAGHNLIHLGFGIGGLLLARTFDRSRLYLIGGGLAYLGLWLWGTVDAEPREWLPLNGADNWLHLAVGVTMVILGLTLAGTRVPTGAEGELLIPD